MSTKIHHSKSVNLIPGSPVWTGVNRGTVAWSGFVERHDRGTVAWFGFVDRGTVARFGFVDRGAYHRMKKITPEGVIFLEEVIVFGIFAASDLF